MQQSAISNRQGVALPLLFVEHISNLDFSFIDVDGQLTGQSWAVDLLLQGDLNEQGMLIDFGDIKKQLKADIESLWDHKLLVPAKRHGLRIQSANEVSLRWNSPLGDYAYRGPRTGTYFVETEQLCKTMLEQHLQQWLLKKWQSQHIQKLSLRFREEQSDHAFFQYSHGLRLHKGACQRIAHGHRSKLNVFTKSGYCKTLSKALAQKLKNAYFVDKHTLKDTSQTQGTLGYEAPEGYYELSLPKIQMIEIQSETTIENIAGALLQCQLLKKDQMSQIVAVQAYEGWHKGAIAVEETHDIQGFSLALSARNLAK